MTAALWFRVLAAVAIAAAAVTIYNAFTSDAYADVAAQMGSGEWFAGWGADPAPRDVNGALLLRSPGDGSEPIADLAISPDGRRVEVVARRSFYSWVFETEQGRELRRLVGSGFLSQVAKAAFSTDGRQLSYSATWDNNAFNIRVFDEGAGENVATFRVAQSSSLVAPELLLDAAARRLVVVTPEGQVTVLDLASASALRQWDAWQAGGRSLGYIALPRSLRARLSADGGTLAVIQDGSVAGADAPITIWDVATGSLRQSVHGPTSVIQDFVLTPSGDGVITVLPEGHVWSTDVATVAGREIVQLPPEPATVAAGGSTDYKLALSADGTALALARVADGPNRSNTVPASELHVVVLDRITGARSNYMLKRPSLADPNLNWLTALAVPSSSQHWIALGFRSGEALLAR